MTQLHSNFNDEQVKQLFSWYDTGIMTKTEVQGQLGVKDSQFYKLLQVFRSDPAAFTISYTRKEPNNILPKTVIQQIHRELETEKRFIDNPAMPIMFYNYAAIRDTVVENTAHEYLSAQTVINYAKKWGFYIERPKNKQRHTREVITDYVGMLLQHDASLHQWSPYALLPNGKPRKWSLITTLDDHSRILLYAELFENETAWAHIQALESVVLSYGIGVQYYSDNHAIFRYVANRDRNDTSAANYQRVLNTDDIAPQWKQCVEATGMKVTYALSPEAKGKIERPYRWLQDRIVRRAAKQNAKTIDEVRQILAQEVDRYNNRQVHSTTKEIPAKRFRAAVNDDRTCFREFSLSKTIPLVNSTKDIFCLRTERRINGYDKISLMNNQLNVPGHLPEGTSLQLHIIPNKKLTEVRILKDNKVLGYQQIPTPRSLQF